MFWLRNKKTKFSLRTLKLSPAFVIQCLGSIGMDCVISELCYVGTILQRNFRKMTITWSFSYNCCVKLLRKKFGSHNMTVLYPNLCYKKSTLSLPIIYEDQKGICKI